VTDVVKQPPKRRKRIASKGEGKGHTQSKGAINPEQMTDTVARMQQAAAAAPAVVVAPAPICPICPIIPKRVATPRQVISAQIDAERGRQNQQWGGAHHDNGHSRRVWTSLIGEHVDRAMKLARSRSASSGDSFRHRLVVTAALCVAAIEAHDRKEQLK